MEGSKWEKWASVLICIFIGGVLLFWGLRRLLPILLPFAVAWLLSLCVARPAERIAKKTRLSPKFCAAALFFLLLMLLVCLVALGVSRLLGELRALFTRLIDEYGSFEEMGRSWLERLEDGSAAMGLFDSQGREGSAFRAHFYDMVTEMLSSALSQMASRLPSFAANVLGALPSLLLGIVVTVMAGFYFCIDRERIGRAVVSLLPSAARRELPRLRARAKRISWRYVKAYLCLMLVTFLLLLFGFLLLRVPYAFLLASVTAFVDLLPVLGIGTVLIPWSILLLIRGSRYLGFGLLILYGICALTRQILEPRLIGKSLGLHPLLTLAATYAGWRVAGVLGMLIAPIFALIGRSLYLQIPRNEEMVKKDD